MRTDLIKGNSTTRRMIRRSMLAASAASIAMTHDAIFGWEFAEKDKNDFSRWISAGSTIGVRGSQRRPSNTHAKHSFESANAAPGLGPINRSASHLHRIVSGGGPRWTASVGPSVYAAS